MNRKTILSYLIISAIIIESVILVVHIHHRYKYRSIKILKTVSNPESLSMQTLTDNPETTIDIATFDIKKYERLKRLGS